jgi:hypothetical protein
MASRVLPDFWTREAYQDSAGEKGHPYSSRAVMNGEGVMRHFTARLALMIAAAAVPARAEMLVHRDLPNAVY